MTFDLAIFQNNRERRITNVYPQINQGVPKIISAADSVQLGGTLGAAIDNKGIRNSISTDGTLNNVAGVKGDLMYCRAMGVCAYFRFKLNQLNSERVFIGLTSIADSAMVNGDSPTGNFVGLSFSTIRNDQDFMFIRNDGGVMPAAVSSGVAADTEIHDLYIWTQPAGEPKIVIQLDNARKVFTTDLPNLSILMRYDMELKALAAAVKKLETGKISIDQES
ncbi:hypothetical protein [Candidatus Nitrosotenuis cloacae]|uniref:hypothetical protein n=1 Tax=Candidatus Nitrosotenuis cloacae TaxID=1603555 RepID=UPI00227F35E9|nr:hypothetical protein [Candidatus Nitrosotenuis cloacae]